MTYTQYVSTLNHMVANKGYRYMAENTGEWLDVNQCSEEHLAYAIGLVEYCCNLSEIEYPPNLESYRDIKLDTRLYPESVKVISHYVKGYAEESWDKGIPEFARHNILVLEVGNAV